MSEILLKSLKGKKNFAELFKTGKRFSRGDGFAVINFSIESYSKIDNPKNVRIIFYAVSISKKTAKKAVVRNRLKRLMRESVRQLSLEYGLDLFDGIDQIIFIWKKAPKHPKMIHLKDVKPTIEKLLLEYADFYKKKSAV